MTQAHGIHGRDDERSAMFHVEQCCCVSEANSRGSESVSAEQLPWGDVAKQHERGVQAVEVTVPGQW